MKAEQKDLVKRETDLSQLWGVGHSLLRVLAVAVVSMAVGLEVSAEPVDGFYWPTAWYQHLDTFQSQTRYWEGNVVPTDGGVAYFTGTQAGDIKFGSTVTLRGLDFGSVKIANGSNADHPRILQSGLVLTGDDTLLDKSNRYVLATATDAVIGQPPPVDGVPKRWQVKVIGNSLLLCPPARALSVFIK